MKRVHALNGVGWVEPVNAVLASDAWGRVPFHVRRDIRDSSLLPSRREPGEQSLVPCMDLNLILDDEAINMIVCDIPDASMRLLPNANLSKVERIIIDCGQPFDEAPMGGELLTAMQRKGFAGRSAGSVVVFDRSAAHQGDLIRTGMVANCA